MDSTPGYFAGKNILVTGGASFIGSHLVEALIKAGAGRISVFDDLSSGKASNLAHLGYETVNGKVPVHTAPLSLHQVNLLHYPECEFAVKFSKPDIVFHLACIHGGRGFVELSDALCAQNLALDNNLFRACVDSRVGKVVYMSSACAYPIHWQTENISIDLVDSIFEDGIIIYAEYRKLGYIPLEEHMVGPPYAPDGLYGHAKLLGELTLKALHKATGLKSGIGRGFTIYGPRGLENHAVIAMIARAYTKENPYQIWGDGSQIRNWTYVEDVVQGLLRIAEVEDEAGAYNLGTEEAITVKECAEMAMRHFGHSPHVEFDTTKPIGPLRRVADGTRSREVLGWSPAHDFATGFRKTAEWYASANTKDEAMFKLKGGALTERSASIHSKGGL